MHLMVARRHGGLGDWLMCLAALRWMRAQHPSVELTVNFSNAPRLAVEAFEASDLTFSTGVKAGRMYLIVDHLVYDYHSGEPYMQGIARELSAAIGCPVTPALDDLPDLREPLRRRSDRWIATVSQGKSAERGGKEWGSNNWQAFAAALSRRGHSVSQVGAHGEEPLAAAHLRMMGMPLAQLRTALGSARCFVGAENGLAVLAGFLRVPQVTVYGAALQTHGPRMGFEQQKKVGDVTPDELVREVEAWVC